MSDPSREVVEACVTALSSAESYSMREKVLAVIRMYEDMKRIERLAKKVAKGGSRG